MGIQGGPSVDRFDEGEELIGRAISDAESRVLSLAMEGMNDREIGKHLGKSYRTVESQMAKAMRKLNAKTRFHLCHKYKQWLDTERLPKMQPEHLKQ